MELSSQTLWCRQFRSQHRNSKRPQQNTNAPHPLFMPDIVLQAIRTTISCTEMFVPVKLIEPSAMQLPKQATHVQVTTKHSQASDLSSSMPSLSHWLSLPGRFYLYTTLPTHKIPKICTFHSVGFCRSASQLPPFRKRQDCSAHSSHVACSQLGQLAFGHKTTLSTLLVSPAGRAAIASLTSKETSQGQRRHQSNTNCYAAHGVQRAPSGGQHQPM